MNLGDLIVSRSEAAANLVKESQARLAVERRDEEIRQAWIDAGVKELKAAAYQTFIVEPLQRAKIDPAKATRKQQDTAAHGRLYDRALRQIRAIAEDTKAKAFVIDALEHANQDGLVGFVKAASCFVTKEEAQKLGYRW